MLQPLDKTARCCVSTRSTDSLYDSTCDLLEQLAAQALPVQVLLANFSGDAAWSHYEKGIQQVFTEAGLTCPAISGSTESNMPTLQSGLAITMLGEIQQRRAFDHKQLSWYTYGLPLVGEEVLAQPEDVAQLLPIFRRGRQKLFSKYGQSDQKGYKENLPVCLESEVLKAPSIVQNQQGPVRSFC